MVDGYCAVLAVHQLCSALLPPHTHAQLTVLLLLFQLLLHCLMCTLLLQQGLLSLLAKGIHRVHLWKAQGWLTQQTGLSHTHLPTTDTAPPTLPHPCSLGPVPSPAASAAEPTAAGGHTVPPPAALSLTCGSGGSHSAGGEGGGRGRGEEGRIGVEGVEIAMRPVGP